MPLARARTRLTVNRAQAEQFKKADATKRELVDTRNDADQRIHATEKALSEHKDKLSAALVQGA